MIATESADTNPVEKVVSLLDSLAAKIMKEASHFAATETELAIIIDTLKIEELSVRICCNSNRIDRV